MNASEDIIDKIVNGVKINFETIPPRAMYKNNNSALRRADFVVSEIERLLKVGCIEEQEVPPYVTNPLTVSENSGKCRLILDLRHVNAHIPDEYIRYDDWKVFQNFLSEDGWLYKFDLSSGYHHLDIHIDFQKYLGFSWSFKQKTRYFVFTVLTFSLKSAPRIFTKTLRPLSTYWRDLGIQIAVYLDDGGGAENDLGTATLHASLVRDTLIKAGIVIKLEKSVWKPVKVLTWLGITVNTDDKVLNVSHKRINNCQHYILHLLSSPYTTPRKLAKLVGMIISMHFILGTIANLKTRFLYNLITSADEWDNRVNIGEHNEAIR